jgi:hypothetical protein
MCATAAFLGEDAAAGRAFAAHAKRVTARDPRAHVA